MGSHICFDVVFCLFLFEWVSTGWHVQDCLADFGFCDRPTLVCRGIVLCRLANDAKYASFSWSFSSSCCKSGRVVFDCFSHVGVVCHVLDHVDLVAWLFCRLFGWYHPGSLDRHSVFSYLRHVSQSQHLWCNYVWCEEIGHMDLSWCSFGDDMMCKADSCV